MESTLPGLTMLEELSSGPVRTLLRARQSALGRDVLVVRLAPGVRPDSQLGAALRREAEAYARLDHPGVPRLYDFRSEEDQAWLVLEDGGGRTLTEVLRPPLEWRVAAAIALEVARALHHAHDRGVIHGRVSLEHLDLTQQGQVKLGGFGLTTRGASGDVEPLELAQNAGISPEGTLGQPPSVAGDVFGVGCVLFELLTGKSPFGSVDGAAGIGHDARVRLDRVPSLLALAHHVPPALDLLTRRCLEKLPGQRPESMADLAQKLALQLDEPPELILARAAIPNSATTNPPSHPPRPRVPWPNFLRSARAQGVGLGLLGGGVLGLGILFWPGRPTPNHSKVALEEPASARAVSLRVVATPWAHVVIDGVRRETTPFAHPLLLSPGKHEVRFEHPLAAPEIRHIDGALGESVFLDVVLRVERPPPQLEPLGAVIDDSP